MRVAVHFQDESLDLDISEERLVAAWQGPAGVAASEVDGLIRDALEHPRGFPPLRAAVVPGDRVVLAYDPEIPEGRAVLEAICRILRDSGVQEGDITVLVPPGQVGEMQGRDLPGGAVLAVHDPEDRTQLAYLSTTATERRVYLNRLLTDADLVIPVGRLGFDPVLGYRGPWSVLFPGASDPETMRSLREKASDEPPDREHPRPSLVESTEVSWLLGSQFQVGVVAGATGLVRVVAGLEKEVVSGGTLEVDRAWSFLAPARAELVIVGVGRPGMPTRIADLAEALAVATQLVQHGGKVVALSRAEGPIGPAVSRLIAAGDTRLGPSALKGHEKDPDYAAARQLARALAWADVYLLSSLGTDLVEDLSMIALERPEEARRLAASCGSCLVVNQAEWTRPIVAEDAEE
jgi:lactate racemase